MSNTTKRGTKMILTDRRFNGGKPLIVAYLKKVRSNDRLVEILIPDGGGFYKVDRADLTEVS